MSNLFHFLTDLATNPRQQAAFARAPEAMMRAAGLAEADRAVLKAGDRVKVAAVYADELPELAFCMVDPNPDPMPDPDPPPDSGPAEEN